MHAYILPTRELYITIRNVALFSYYWRKACGLLIVVTVWPTFHTRRRVSRESWLLKRGVVADGAVRLYDVVRLCSDRKCRFWHSNQIWHTVYLAIIRIGTTIYTVYFQGIIWINTIETTATPQWAKTRENNQIAKLDYFPHFSSLRDEEQCGGGLNSTIILFHVDIYFLLWIWPEM